MEKRGDEIHVTTTEARGAGTPNVVRYVLLISLVLAIIALSAIWMTGAFNAPQDVSGDGVSNQAPPTN